jgi:thiosulfate reductase cytochrome b subunit
MRSNIDESVDRYLSGAMSEEERNAFIASVANNDEARDLLAANHVIERSFAASASATHAVPNATILAYLGATHPEKSKRVIAWSFIAGFLFLITGLVYYTTQYSAHHLPQAPLSPSTQKVITDTITIVVPPQAHMSEQTQPSPVESRAIQPKPAQTLHEQLAPPKVYPHDSVAMHIHN